MKVSADSIQAHAKLLRNAVKSLGEGKVSRDQLPTAGLSNGDQATLKAAYDYLAKRGLVTPKKLDSLLNAATANALRADHNRDGFVGGSESKGLGSVSGPLVRAAAAGSGFDPVPSTTAPAIPSTDAPAGPSNTAPSSTSPGSGPAGAQNINRALDRLDVEHNRKYLPSGVRGTRSRVTHCNEFAQDALRGIGVPRQNIPGGNANNMNQWLNNQGAQHGWHKVSAQEAQRRANAGEPTVASWRNNNGPHGHVAVVRPGHNDGKVHIAQAGGSNHSDVPVGKGFGRHAPEYFAYDGPVSGRAQAPVRPAAPRATAPAESTAVSGRHAAALLGNRAGSVGGGNPSIDLNGTRYTAIEGRAADNNISIQSKRRFNPLTENGVALTTAQARQLGVRVGDTVKIRDTQTGKTTEATYYDNAGKKPDGLKHFEVDPALADALGINYRNRRGAVVDAVTNASQVDGRFVIERN